MLNDETILFTSLAELKLNLFSDNTKKLSWYLYYMSIVSQQTRFTHWWCHLRYQIFLLPLLTPWVVKGGCWVTHWLWSKYSAIPISLYITSTAYCCRLLALAADTDARNDDKEKSKTMNGDKEVSFTYILYVSAKLS